MEPDWWLDYPLGEVAGSPRPFTGTRAPVGINGTHYCGTAQDFREGCLYLPALPLVRYGADGFPLCCGGAVVARGGAGASGRSATHVIPALRLYGGAGASGRSVYLATYVDAAEGGVEIGGEVGDVWGFIDPAEGGVEIGGSAVDHQVLTDGAEGGVEIGGSAGDVWTGGTPPPGTTCLTAPLLTLGTAYAWTTPAVAGVEQWFRWNTGAGAFVFSSTGLSGVGGVVAELWEGIKCGVATLLVTVAFDSMAIITAGSNVWLKVTDAGGGATPYSFNLT